MRKFLLAILFLTGWAVTSYSAYQIICPSEGIVAVNETGQKQTMVNGVLSIYVFTVNDYDNQLGATDCYVNQIPNNQVFTGNALIQ